MLKAQDEILMAEHLAIHRAKIDNIDQAVGQCSDEVASLLSAERRLLANHVDAMQDLLEGREPRVEGRHGEYPSFADPHDLDDPWSRERSRSGPLRRYAAGIESHAEAGEVAENLWTSRHLAVENLHSALKMHDRTAQRAHIGMALDQAVMAMHWQHLADREGYMRAAPSSRGVHSAVEDDYARPALSSARSAERWRR